MASEYQMGNSKSELAEANATRQQAEKKARAEDKALRTATRKRHRIELDRWLSVYIATLSNYYTENKVLLKEQILKTNEPLPIELKFDGPVPSFLEKFEHWNRRGVDGRGRPGCSGHRGSLYEMYYLSYRKAAKNILGLPVRFGRLVDREGHYILTMQLLLSQKDQKCACWERQMPGLLTNVYGTDCEIHGDSR